MVAHKAIFVNANKVVAERVAATGGKGAEN